MATNGRTLSAGAYVIITDDDVILESSEIRALRKAVAMGAAVKFVEWGKSVSDGKTPASTPTVRKPRAAKPTAEPVAINDTDRATEAEDF